MSTQISLPLRTSLAERMSRADAAGATYDAALDQRRLSTQLLRVYALMRDGGWRSLREIAVAIGASSEAGTSARLRQLDRDFGIAHEKRRRGDGRQGVWEYRIKDGAQ